MNGSIDAYLFLGFVLSLAITIGGVVVIAIVLVKLPAEYFEQAANPLAVGARPFLRLIGFLLKQLLGAALVAIGLIMSVPGVPGPGVVMIVIGLMLLEFARKRRLAGWVMRRAPILHAANSLRRRCGKTPLIMPPADRR